MTTFRFVGDIHAEWYRYLEVIKGSENSIQVGDFGLGFGQNPVEYAGIDPTKHRFIRGNHDAPALCEEAPNWIPDGHFDAEHSMFFVGGAVSIDIHLRTEGITWWKDEELSIERLYAMHDAFVEAKPRIMVTHECPEFVPPLMKRNYHKDTSRTRQAFQSMWEMHKPEIWIYGHWHGSFDRNIMGTRFICLNILEHIDVDIPQVSVTS